MNQVDFSQAGNAQQPSGAVWGSCPGPVLNDIGAGYYVHEDFLGGTVNFADGVGVGGQNPFEIDADTGTTIAKLTGQGGLLADAISGTDNNASALFQYPMGPLTLNSGFESWFEARVAINALGDGNFGLFFGWAAQAVMSRDVIADNPDSIAAGLAGDSLFGVACMSNNVGLLYAVIAKDGGGTTTIASDLGHSSALTAAQQFTLADNIYHKVGMRFDGKKTLYFYIDGIQVVKYTLTTTVANSTDNLAPIVAIKTGAATARQLNIDWIRAAYRTRR